MSAGGLEWAGLILSWLLTICAVAYNRWNALYLFVTRLRFRLLNPTSLWSVHVTMRGEFDPQSLDHSIDHLRRLWPDTRKQYETTTSKTVRLDGLLLELRWEQIGDENWQDSDADAPTAVATQTVVKRAVATTQLAMTVRDIRASYRESSQLVDRLSSLVEEINRSIGARPVEFGSVIRFPSTNPYFGVWVRRLRPKELKSFLCAFAVEAEGGGVAGTVTVGLAQIELVSSSAVHWAMLSKRYLAVK